MSTVVVPLPAAVALLGVSDLGVSISIASSLFVVFGVETDWLAPPLAFLRGGMLNVGRGYEDMRCLSEGGDEAW